MQCIGKRLSGKPAFGFRMRRRLQIVALTFLIVATGSSPSYSQNANMDESVDGGPISIETMQAMFRDGGPGNKHFCAIVVTQQGLLAPSPDNMELSSRQQGGRPGIAQVTATNSSYDLTIDPPGGFVISPTGGSADTTFTSTYSATGATNVADSPGQFALDIKRGVSQIEANFIATRNNSPFPAGQYSAELVLRCE
jgi:hypothetical protein